MGLEGEGWAGDGQACCGGVGGRGLEPAPSWCHPGQGSI